MVTTIDSIEKNIASLAAVLVTVHVTFLYFCSYICGVVLFHQRSLVQSFFLFVDLTLLTCKKKILKNLYQSTVNSKR